MELRGQGGGEAVAQRRSQPGWTLSHTALRRSPADSPLLADGPGCQGGPVLARFKWMKGHQQPGLLHTTEAFGSLGERQGIEASSFKATDF